MISCTEFIWVYVELFRYLEKRGGDDLLIKFWKGISENFLANLREYVESEGFAGMHRYWSHTLGEEGGRHTMSLYDDMFVIDMHECPSAKLVFENGRIAPYPKYCDHCRWLYPPLLADLGYDAQVDIIDNKKGQCRLTVTKQSQAR